VIHRRTARFEGVHQGVHYLEFLKTLAAALAPRHYLEIGTDEGESLRVIDADAIAVDPEFKLTKEVVGRKRVLHFYQMTSDAFFARYSPRAIFGGPVDLAFLDGMHRLEFLLRDLINTERHCHRGSLLLIHDCLPTNTRMAERVHRKGEAWTGDIWLLLPALRKLRPELRVLLFDCPPTGLVAISGLDPANEVLARHYHALLDEFVGISIESFGFDTLMGLYPMIDSHAVAAHPEDLTALLSVAPFGGCDRP
jgi:hypothetical protein